MVPVTRLQTKILKVKNTQVQGNTKLKGNKICRQARQVGGIHKNPKVRRARHGKGVEGMGTGEIVGTCDRELSSHGFLRCIAARYH